ncbi:MAG: hypothetical protein AMXMBFR47_10620 [Planctomycetota bacterium]
MAMTNPPDPEALDNLILNRLRVEYNYARFRGTGLAVGSKGDIVRISNCRFEHNFNLGVHETSQDIGGGAAVYSVFTNLHIQNSVFFDNHTTMGGGGGLLVKHVIGPEANGIIVANCSFHGNTASASIGDGAIAGYPDFRGTALDEVSIWNAVAWGDSAPEFTPFQTTPVKTWSICFPSLEPLSGFSKPVWSARGGWPHGR